MERNIDGVVYRRARIEDKDGVFAIRTDLYGGQDYLTFCYDHFIAGDNTTCYLAETSIDKEIIGFCVGFLVDDGQTVVVRAARVKEAFTGRGIYKNLLAMCLEESPAPKHAFVVNSESLKTKKSLQTQYCHYLTKNLYSMYAYRKDIRIAKHIQSHLQDLKVDSIKTLLDSTITRETIFPQNRILIHSVPFKPLSSNIPLFRDIGSRVVMFSDVNQTGRCYSGLFTSWSSFLAEKAKLICSADVYGSDLSVFGSHLASFLAGVQSECWDMLDLNVYLEPEADCTILEKVLTDFRLKRYVHAEGATGVEWTNICLLQK